MNTAIYGKVGQMITNRMGDKMIIIDDRDDKLTVMFQDGTVLGGQLWQWFRSGTIMKPDSTPDLQKFVGKETEIQDNFHEHTRTCRCIEVRGDKLVLRFLDNGEIIDGVFPKDFISGYLPAADSEMQAGSKQSVNLAMERERTVNHALQILRLYHRCAIVRPCGFGKTTSVEKIVEFNPQYRRILYLSPGSDKNSQIVDAKERLRKLGRKVATRTYSWLRKLSDQQLKETDYDFVVFDECHSVGGDEEGRGAYVTYLAIIKLMMFHPDTHFLGLTATQIRMDGIDVIGSIFLNHTVYPYGIDDAIRDGYMLPPKYYYCEYGVKELVTKKIEAAEKYYSTSKESKEHILNREQIEKIFDSDDVQRIDAIQMPRHIKEACDKLQNHTYMRFLVFYLTIDLIEENKETVTQWFQEAYPDYTICCYEYHYKSPLRKADLDSLERRPKTIDLIFSCAKLKEEYHGKDDTGIVMDRRTKSYSLYVQMLGRIMQCGSDRQTIVFDIADNLHSDFVIPPLNKALDEETKRLVEEAEYEPKAPLTFEEAKRMFRGAVDWDKINKESKKKQEEKPRKKHEKKREKAGTAVVAGMDAGGTMTGPAEEQDDIPGQNELNLFKDLAEKARHQPIEQSIADYIMAVKAIGNADEINLDQGTKPGAEAQTGYDISQTPKWMMNGSEEEYGNKPETNGNSDAEPAYRAESGHPAAQPGQNVSMPDSGKDEDSTHVQADTLESLMDTAHAAAVKTAARHAGTGQPAGNGNTAKDDLGQNIRKVIAERRDLTKITGFSANIYKHYNSRLFSKQFVSRFEEASVDDVIAEVFVRHTKDVLDKIMEIYDKRANRYNNYEDYLKDKNAKKLMKASADLYRIRPQIVEEYMITGVVPRWT